MPARPPGGNGEDGLRTAVIPGRTPGSMPPPEVALHRLRDRVLFCKGYQHGVRWRPGERLERLFEERCDRLRAAGQAGRLCVDTPREALTYDQVDARANQLARHLLARRIGPGCRVALLLDDPVQAYIGMLAVLKAGAAYIPLDPCFPADRLSYIVTDSGATAVLTVSRLRAKLANVRATIVCVDEMAHWIAAESERRITPAERGNPTDNLAYIIYTSGSTGRPKGVAVEHPSICNFVRVAAEVYGLRPDDRIYQGLTLAFDFSVEEIWVPWTVGATLVPKPAGATLLGTDLHEFLVGRRVTAMCCVPTLLATLEQDLPNLRFLLVSGEACPKDLITRWHRPDRRFLNVYGPTEATVTATWSVVRPDRPVTIGVPLPTYYTVILDPENPRRALPHGEVGEIGIAGIGLAVGYVNRDDLTAKAFIPDHVEIPGNPSRRIYRTGDLGRVTPDGEIEYLGRIDLQVKIRGYRIELTEIESVLMQVPGIAQAVVGTHEAAPGNVELVGYYTLRSDAATVDPEQIYAVLRDRLPSYMVPAYLEHLAVIPMTTSDKADRKKLPPPTRRRNTGAHQDHAPAGSETERVLAETLATILGLDRVSVTSHFFDDLGASSLLMAQFSALLRRRTTLPPIPIKDLYLRPTVAELAAGLDGEEGRPTQGPPRRASQYRSTGTVRYLLCGLAQLLAFLALGYGLVLVLVRGLEWIAAVTVWWEIWLRGLAFSAGTFVAACALPIVLKWLLVGRWKPTEFPLWGLRYLRFWGVKTVVRANPMVLFAGSPLYNVYLRALGAKVGRSAVVFSRNVPVCTDLVSIGAGTVIRKDTYLNGYRALAGRIQTGTVRIGRDVLVSEHAVIDIGASMGDGSQIGHASSLQSGQAVPAGERWHGSPAQPTEVDYRAVDPARCGTLRRFAFAAMQLVSVLVLYLPLILTLVITFLPQIPRLPGLLGPGETAETDWTFYRDALAFSSALYLGGLVLGLVYVVIVPRLLHLGLQPDTAYPLYGIRYWLQRTISRSTNSRFYTFLFGDSSAIVHYLRAIGYDFGRVEQSGSNFGVEVKHESPYLAAIGTGTMVSDGLSIMNAQFSNTSFSVSRAALGSHSFFGNNIAYPAAGKTGDNCLLATKVQVPVDGPVRENVGLLGSPAFEIPRSVHRGIEFDHKQDPEELRYRLRAKNRHNAVTALLYLIAGLVNLYATTLLLMIALDYYARFGVPAIFVATLLSLLFTIAFWVLLERGVTGFRRMRPTFCSIYHPYFWWHERFWKMSAGTYLAMFNGTPMKNVLWRMIGVRVGRKVFDDGCAIPEKSLVTIGACATLNAGSVIQAHSLEDGWFKSDHVSIGDGGTLGVGAFVHYGVAIEEGAVLEADSFLMKGEQVPRFTVWRGNPATAARMPAPVRPDPPAPARPDPPVPVRPDPPAPVRPDPPVPVAAPAPPRLDSPRLDPPSVPPRGRPPAPQRAGTVNGSGGRAGTPVANRPAARPPPPDPPRPGTRQAGRPPVPQRPPATRGLAAGPASLPNGSARRAPEPPGSAARGSQPAGSPLGGSQVGGSQVGGSQPRGSQHRAGGAAAEPAHGANGANGRAGALPPGVSVPAQRAGAAEPASRNGASRTAAAAAPEPTPPRPTGRHRLQEEQDEGAGSDRRSSNLRLESQPASHVRYSAI